MEKKFKIMGMTFHPYQISVLSACEDVHMYSNGSTEYWDPVVPWFLYSYLRETLNQWTDRDKKFDLCVKRLVEQTVEEYDSASFVPDEEEALKYWKVSDGKCKDGIIGILKGHMRCGRACSHCGCVCGFFYGS